MYWTRSSRYRAGGFWHCAVRHRDRIRDRYDSDPVHRIEKNLRNDALKRRQKLERRRAAFVSDYGGQ